MPIQQEALSENIWLVRVDGRLDQNLNPELEECLAALLADGHAKLIVDLTEATYINSGGLRSLVTAWRKARLQDGTLALCGLNARLEEIFSMVGFDKVFLIYATCDAAQQAILSGAEQ